MGGVSIISGTQKSMSGTISDLKIIMSITILFLQIAIFNYLILNFFVSSSFNGLPSFLTSSIISRHSKRFPFEGSVNLPFVLKRSTPYYLFNTFFIVASITSPTFQTTTNPHPNSHTSEPSH